MATISMKKLKIAIILFYVALFAGLALYDEKPDPELAREMARPQPEVVDPGNAWLLMLGFSAPEGVSPYARGEEKIRIVRDAVSKRKAFGEYYKSIDDGKSALAFKGKLPSVPNTKDGGMLRYAATHAKEIAVLSRYNRELLERYETLRKCQRYAEPLGQGDLAPIPSFAPIRHAQRLQLLQFAVLAIRGDLAKALEGVSKDAEFWRFVSCNSTMLITRLIAIHSLSTDLRFAAELGASHSLTGEESALVMSILRPFDKGESVLAATLRGEALYVQRGLLLSTWQTMKKWSPEKLVFKQNATRNRMFDNFREFIRLAQLPPHRYAQEMKGRKAEKAGAYRIGVPFLYNSVGEILATIGVPDLHSFIERGHDLEGLRRLALLKVLARQENIQPEGMQRFLDGHARDLGNPYTDGPMTWDGKKGSISFKDLSGEKPVEMFL